MRHEYVGGIMRPTYRVGDVLDLIASDLHAAEEARIRREEAKARPKARRDQDG